ncbi:LOW QUALITY PROTEIN: TIM21-domain-containing protein [Jimgerdemannia flammicorona]|uniref:Mitochondrial import inner membrane translocase subunit Tim21 n=1 Tax=Jimgerdemannia flammicorona TaxID=994334 RepID=A0A433D1M1_9FUNG|nr:LOW QUALITY PROTEIN: TIM21-domain-containing protein [Jimgerdemannia flammicorona]
MASTTLILQSARRAFCTLPRLRPSSSAPLIPTRHTARAMATGNRPAQKRSALVKQSTVKEWKDLSTPQKVVATTKVTANVGIIVVGLGILGQDFPDYSSDFFWRKVAIHYLTNNDSNAEQKTHPFHTAETCVGALTYYILSELMGSQSSTAIFSDALEKARSNPELQDLIGTPMKGHGEPSRNRMRRNRRVSYQIANDMQGNEHLLMRFYVEGPNGEGTGFLEMVKDTVGKWEYKYIFVDVPGQGLPSKRIFLIYNGKAGKKEDIKVPEEIAAA